MAIIIKSKNPQKILDLFIDNIIKHNIVTWLIDSDGDFTIANAKWTYKAWMRPIIQEESNMLVFGFVSSKKYNITKGLYGIYHGRMAVTLLANYDELITSIEIKPHLDSSIDVF